MTDFHTEWTRELQQALLAPLEGAESFLPRGADKGEKGTPRRCMGLIYADAAAVLARLNEAVGPGWTFETELLGTDPAVVLRGRLTILGVTREDFGEAAKEQEPFKSAWSDCLKRCARTFGIGLYLWSVGETWGEHDGWKWTKPPVLTRDARLAALRLAGWTGTLGQPESRGDARAQQAVTRAERPAPQVEARPDAAEAELAALKAECKRLHIQLVGTDEQESRSADYRVRLGLPPGTALSPAEWAKLRALLVELTTDPFEVPDAGSVPSDDGNPVPGAFR